MPAEILNKLNCDKDEGEILQITMKKLITHNKAISNGVNQTIINLNANNKQHPRKLKVGLFYNSLLRVAIILVTLMALNVPSYAQLEKLTTDIQPTWTFYDIYTPQTAYLSNLKSSVDSATYYSGGGEYKEFKRFQNFWEPRLYPDKTFASYFLAHETYYENTSQNYSYASTEKWRELGPTKSSVGNGPVEFLTFFDNGTAASTQYMLTGALQSGLFYSEDHGETWRPAGTDTGWRSSGCSWATFHPTDHKSWCASSSGNTRKTNSSWMGRTGGVYLTTDEGQSWERKADYNDFGEYTKIRKLIWDPTNTNVLYVATSKGIFKTIELYNTNPTWTKIPKSDILVSDIFDIELKPDDSDVLYATGYEEVAGNLRWRVMKSTDNGSTWTELLMYDGPDKSYLTIEVSKAKPDYLYLCKVENSKATISYHDNTSWTEIINNSNMDFSCGNGFGVEQVQDGETFIISKSIFIKKLSINGTGPDISSINHVDVEDVVYHPYNPDEVWICTHGGPEKSINGGNTWQPKYNGVGTAMATKMATSYTNPEYVMLGLYHDGTQITRTPYSDNWKPNWQKVSWGDGQQPLIDNKDPRYMWSTRQKGWFYYSNNYFLSVDNTIYKKTQWLTQAVLNKENSNYLYTNKKSASSGFKNEVNRYTSRGATSGDFISDFENMLDPSIKDILIIGMVTPYYSNDELIVWLTAREGTSGNGFHVFRTRNANAADPTAVNWTKLDIPRTDYIKDIEFDPYNTDKLYICYSNSSDQDSLPFGNKFIWKADYTDVGNPDFIDITRNLPYAHTGSYCLEYERGSDGVLYLATDFGVFTTDNQLLNSNDSWQKLGVGFPHCHSANGIEINYPMNLLRVGTEGRGAWELPLPCRSETTEIEINQNTTWNEDKRLNRGVIVKSGNTLTIANARISFPNGAGIKVEPGAKLVLDNGTLSNACQGLWQGVLVQGDPTYDQSNITNQGVLEMENGSIIENAEVAVYVGETFVNNVIAPVSSNPGGGIIKIQGSQFLNNQKDVVMRPYELWSTTTQKPIPQASYIRASSFIGDEKMLQDASLLKGKMGCIYTYGIHGLKIQGNTFENQNNSISIVDKGTGITAVNSALDISSWDDPQCVTCQPIKNEFLNLYYGIVITNGIYSSDLIQITNNDFDNTYRNVFLSGTNNAEVLLNDIKVSDQVLVQAGQPNPGTPYGIYINGGRGFKIEENVIHRSVNNGPASFNGSRGIIVHKTGAVDNEIYKNTFTNLFLSQQGQCYNSGTDLPPWYGQNNPGADVGLKFFCNTSQTNESSYDLWVGGENYCTPNSSVVIGSQRFGIAEVQGRANPGSTQYPYLPAGNRFSDSHLSLPTTATVDFDNGEAAWLEYWWDDLDGNGSAGWEPLRKDNVTNQEIPVSFDVCPSKISSGGGSIPDLYSGLSDAQIALNSSITLLNIWQNGGDTDLDEEVATTQPWDIYQQFNELLAISPYLDEGVLIEVIQNPGFTSLMVKLLMIANPHAVNSDEVMAELEERVPPLPEAYMDEILSQPETSSQLQTLKGNLAANNHLVSSISEEIKAIYRADTENEWVKDSLINFVSRRPGLYDQYELATIYLSYGQYTDMQTVLDNIENNFEMDDEMGTDFNDYETLLNLVVDMQEENLYESSLSETEVTVVENILVNEQPLTASLALSILKRNNPEYEYNEPVYDLPEEYSMAQPPAPETIVQQYDNSEFKLYPNPSHDYTTLMYDCSYSNLTYFIMDATGKEVKTDVLKTIEDLSFNEILIDLSGISSGTYYFVVKTNKEILFSDKLIITE